MLPPTPDLGRPITVVETTSSRIALSLPLLALVVIAFGLGAFTITYVAADGLWASAPVVSDRELQLRATLAAERSAVWALLGLPISFVGLVGLLFSLSYTRKALAQAARSNETTSEALAAARENVKVAERQAVAADKQGELATIQTAIARATSRPWIIIEPGVPDMQPWLDDDINMLHWHYTLSNPGPTPAFVHRLAQELYVPRFEEAYRLARNPPPWLGLTEFPEQHYLAEQNVDLLITGGAKSSEIEVVGGFPMINLDTVPDRAVIARHLKYNSGMAWLIVRVWYSDTWGDEHETAEIFTTEPSHPAALGEGQQWKAVRVNHQEFTRRS